MLVAPSGDFPTVTTKGPLSLTTALGLPTIPMEALHTLAVLSGVPGAEARDLPSLATAMGTVMEATTEATMAAMATAMEATVTMDKFAH